MNNILDYNGKFITDFDVISVNTHTKDIDFKVCIKYNNKYYYRILKWIDNDWGIFKFKNKNYLLDGKKTKFKTLYYKG